MEFKSTESYDPIQRKNKLQTIVSSYLESDDKSLKTNQNAKISRIDINENKDFTYHLKSKCPRRGRSRVGLRTPVPHRLGRRRSHRTARLHGDG